MLGVFAGGLVKIGHIGKLLGEGQDNLVLEVVECAVKYFLR